MWTDFNNYFTFAFRDKLRNNWYKNECLTVQLFIYISEKNNLYFKQ